MRMTVRRSLAALAILALSVATVRSQESLRIVPFITGDRVVVSFELNDAYNDAVREAIASGLRTTFSYDLELRARAWVGRTIGTAVVATTDRYEQLKRRPTLPRMVDG